MKTEELTYDHEGVTCRGYVAYNETDSLQPAAMIAPSWAGRDAFTCQKAEQLAALGYVGFAIDMYGDAKVGTSKEENASLMTPLIENRALLQGRMQAAAKAIRSLDHVDSQQLAAIGYCFGGLCALDLARTETPLAAVVSFHGILTAPDNITPKNITAPILVLHGYQDPMVSPEQILEFADEMKSTNANWELCAYGNAVHAFTNPEANDPDFGTVYNPVADKRSWQRMVSFLAECFNHK